MEKTSTERIRDGLREKSKNLETWLSDSSPLEKQLRLGTSTEEAVQVHLETIEQALEKSEDQSLGVCEVCHEPIEPELIEMDYTCCVCLDHLSVAESRQLEAELEMAGQVQQSLLPRQEPKIPGLDVAAYSRPAQIVGGDYFDFFEFRDHRSGIVIADVSGHGVSASLHMVSLQTLLRTLAPESHSTTKLIDNFQRLYSHNIHFTTFVTVFISAYAADTQTLYYCNAGHNPPLIIRQNHRAGQAPIWLRPTGPAVGLVEDARFAEAQIRLEPGDLLVLYTDGLTEATNPANEVLGQGRLEAWLSQETNLSAREAIQIIRDGFREFAGGKSAEDDLTVVVGKVEGV